MYSGVTQTRILVISPVSTSADVVNHTALWPRFNCATEVVLLYAVSLTKTTRCWVTETYSIALMEKRH